MALKYDALFREIGLEDVYLYQTNLFVLTCEGDLNGVKRMMQ